MALVVNVRENNLKPIATKSSTYMDYQILRNYFSIWTYRQNDPNREVGATQNIQLELDMAIVLRDALNRFIQEGR